MASDWRVLHFIYKQWALTLNQTLANVTSETRDKLKVSSDEYIVNFECDVQS